MKYPATLDGLLDAENGLESLESEYLRLRGWRLNCEIGALWLWTKEIKGKTIYVNRDTALQYERMWSDEPREGDEE